MKTDHVRQTGRMAPGHDHGNQPAMQSARRDQRQTAAEEILRQMRQQAGQQSDQ